MIAAFCLELRSPFLSSQGDLFLLQHSPLLCRRSLRADELILPVHFHLMVWGSSYFFSWADPFYADLSFFTYEPIIPLFSVFTNPLVQKDYSSYHIDRRQPSLTVRHLLVKPIQVSPLGTMPCNVLCDTMLPVRQPVRYDSKYESCYENLLF